MYVLLVNFLKFLKGYFSLHFTSLLFDGFHVWDVDKILVTCYHEPIIHHSHI